MKPWPLAVSPFGLPERLRLCWWLLQNHQWTAGARVWEYEQAWERYTGAEHAIMVANGSQANELIAEYRKWQLMQAGEWPKRNKVIFPVCTWVSSVSPWLRMGFEPVWVDISTNLCGNIDAIAKHLSGAGQYQIGTVFYTTLGGIASQLGRLREICAENGVELMLDNCEAAFSFTEDQYTIGRRHVCSLATSSASFYFSHHTTTGTEGGMIFTRDAEAADWFRMARNHGLTRGMPVKYQNTDAHPLFDFYWPGTNARSSDLQAFMGLLVLAKQQAFSDTRSKLVRAFYNALSPELYDDPTQWTNDCPLMFLPIIPKSTSRHEAKGPFAVLRELGIELRPVVGGNLLRQTAFKSHGNPKHYPRAEHIHDHGCYVGLHEGVTLDMILELAEALNRA